MSALTDRIHDLHRHGAVSVQEIASVVGLTPTEVADRLRDPTLPDPTVGTGVVGGGGVGGGGSGSDLLGAATDWADRDVPRWDVDQGRFVSSGPQALEFLQDGGKALTTQFNVGDLGRSSGYPDALDETEAIVTFTEDMKVWDDIGVDIYGPQGAILPSGVYVFEAGFFGVSPGPGYAGPSSPETALLKTFSLGINTFAARSLAPNNSLAVGNATLGRDVEFGGLVVTTVQDVSVDLSSTFLGEAATGQYGFVNLTKWSCARHDDTPRNGILDGHTLNGVYLKIAKIG